MRRLSFVVGWLLFGVLCLLSRCSLFVAGGSLSFVVWCFWFIVCVLLAVGSLLLAGGSWLCVVG